MSATSLVDAAKKDFAVLRREARAARHTGGDPFLLAWQVVVSAGGHPAEVNRYTSADHEAEQFGRVAFKSVLSQVATQLAAQHPELGPQVLMHKAVRKKVDKGPLARMTFDQKVVRIIAGFLLDPLMLDRWVRRGLFGWDDGRHQAAVLMNYAWRICIGKSTWFLHKPRYLRVDSSPAMRTLLGAYRGQAWADLLQARYRQAWYHLNQAEVDRSQAIYRDLGARKLDGAQAAMADLGVVDLGLRARAPAIIDQGVDALIGADLVTEDHPFLLHARATARMVEGDHIKAIDLATRAQDLAQTPFHQHQAAELIRSLDSYTR